MKDKIIAELEKSYTDGRSISSIIGFRKVYIPDIIDTEYVTVSYEDGASEEIELDVDWYIFLNRAYGTTETKAPLNW